MDRPRRRGRPASFWVAVFLALFLAGSLFLVFVLVVSLFSAQVGGGDLAGPGRFTRHVLAGDREAEDSIGLLPVRGVIVEGTGWDASSRGHDTVGQVRARLRAFRDDPTIRAVLVELDTPGGGITASDVIREELLRFKQSKGIPLVALMNDVAASGGYYVATACDRIIAHRTTITGSIGVIFSLLNIHQLLEKVGVQDLSLISPNTPFKDSGSPMRAMRPDEKAWLLGLVEEMYERFLEVVEEGRPALDPAEIRRLADGRIYSGQQALELGLVDDLGYLDDALEACRVLAGIAQAKLVSFDPEPTLLEALIGVSEGSRAPRALDPTRLLGGFEPRFYYLWPGGALAPLEGEVPR